MFNNDRRASADLDRYLTRSDDPERCPTCGRQDVENCDREVGCAFGIQAPDLFDVVAVNNATGAQRTIAMGKTAADAEAIVKMAVMRRGVTEEHFKTVPH